MLDHTLSYLHIVLTGVRIYTSCTRTFSCATPPPSTLICDLSLYLSLSLSLSLLPLLSVKVLFARDRVRVDAAQRDAGAAPEHLGHRAATRGAELAHPVLGGDLLRGVTHVRRGRGADDRTLGRSGRESGRDTGEKAVLPSVVLP